MEQNGTNTDNQNKIYLRKLNYKIDLAKKVLADSWDDMDREYKSSRKGASICAFGAGSLILLNVLIVLFLSLYYIYGYEKIKNDLRKEYYQKIVDNANKHNLELNDLSKKYHAYVRSLNPDNNNIPNHAKEYMIKVPEYIKKYIEEDLEKDNHIVSQNQQEVPGLMTLMEMEDIFEDFLMIRDNAGKKLAAILANLLVPFMLFSMFILIILLRHQKKLLSEVRYFGYMKYQIKLFSNLLDASQYVATETDDIRTVGKYVEDTFTSIREQLLLIGNSQHNEENQNADGDTSVLMKIVESLTSIQQNNNKSNQ